MAQIENQDKKEREMLYVCSPLRGDVEQNIQNAMDYCAQAVQEGYIPIAPHAMYRGMFDDEIPAQRAAALEIGLQLLEKCTRMWVCGEHISEGMAGEIAQAEHRGMPVEQKPSSYFRERQTKAPATFRELRDTVDRSIRACEKEPIKILELLDLKAQHHRFSLTNAAAIHKQNPDAQFTATYHEWHKMGIRVKDWRHSIKVWTPVQNQAFLREGKQTDVAYATQSEREEIIKGHIPVQEHVTYRMSLVYDISQTDCKKEDYAQIIGNPYTALYPGQLYECTKALATKCGFDVIERTDPHVVALKGYCLSDVGEIHISGKLRIEEKLSELCSAFAQGMVTLTSTQPQSVQEFESKAFSYLLHKRFALPLHQADRQALIAAFANAVSDSATAPTDCFAHLQKAGNMTFRGIDKEIAALWTDAAPEQTAQKEISQAQKEINKNFIQDVD